MEDERVKIAEGLYKLLCKFGIDNEEKDYVAYIVFGICGSGLLRAHGEERFDEICREIKEINYRLKENKKDRL